MKPNHHLDFVRIKLITEKRLYSEEELTSSQKVVQFISKELAECDREVLCILNCNAKCQVINMNVVSMGSLTETLVTGRELFKSAILSNARGVILHMGKKSFTGNIVLTPDECRTLKNYAVSSFAEKAEKLKYQQKYETAKKDAGVWKKRYEKLMEQAQPYLDAVKLAPERVRAFLNAVLTRGKEVQDISQERGRKRKESTIDR